MPQKQQPARTALSLTARSVILDTLHLVEIGAIALGLQSVAGNEAQGRGVDAVAKPAAVLRAIGEHMAEVAVAMRRAHLGADRATRAVLKLVHVGRHDRPGEAGPAAAGLDLGGRGK